jgi:hypothetical protein
MCTSASAAYSPARGWTPLRRGLDGVKYIRYWVNDEEGKVFCLVEAPDAETAITVHREAHGLVADRIHEVQEGS